MRSLQGDPITATIPVIVLSSLPQSNAEKLKQEGAIAYVEKSKLDIESGGENLVRLVNAALQTPKRKINRSAEVQSGRSLWECGIAVQVFWVVLVMAATFSVFLWFISGRRE